MKFFDKKSFFKTLFRSLLVAYVFFLVLGYFFADLLLFPAPKSSYKNDESILSLRVKEQSISYRIFTVEEPKYTVLYSHGNAEDIGELDYWAKKMSEELQVNLYIYDYPGYGTSEGKPSVESVTESAEAMYAMLKAKGLKSKEIIPWGRSIGGGPTMALAQQDIFAGVILESTFVSACRVVTRARILPFEYFDNKKAVAAADEPMMFIHGEKDELIASWHGKALYDTAKVPKAYYWVEKAGHNDVEMYGGEFLWLRLREFLKSLD